MKKSLLALAALASFAGAASAQSSVTLFGIVDAAYAHVSAGGKSNKGMTNSGLNSSRLGFRGVEDLGGGLRAGFHIEGQLTNDDGNAAGQTWQRRSTVSLMGNFGEIRLGRDYVPTFWNTTVYDPFGTNGVGQALTPNLIGAAGTPTNSVRANNSVSYFLPSNLGGFSGQIMYAFGESNLNATGKKANDYFGGRVGYAAGPLSVHGAYGKTKGATSGTDTKYTNFGASYNFGVITPMVQFDQEKNGAGNTKINAWLAGVVVPLGQGELRAAYSDYDLKNSNNDWKKLAIGYGYNLSKRTQMYATYARVANDGAQTKTVSNNGLAAPSPNGGGNATGYELGIRHSF
ncbi:porin [Aquabacterium humicola]|uniref:porin n=1 Tax=Aquabacterium humicola TaxID=3237377 RepID=UPI002543D713|nr:porin [Rubrivivax pictus]